MQNGSLCARKRDLPALVGIICTPSRRRRAALLQGSQDTRCMQLVGIMQGYGIDGARGGRRARRLGLGSALVPGWLLLACYHGVESVESKARDLLTRGIGHGNICRLGRGHGSRGRGAVRDEGVGRSASLRRRIRIREGLALSSCYRNRGRREGWGDLSVANLYSASATAGSLLSRWPDLPAFPTVFSSIFCLLEKGRGVPSTWTRLPLARL